MPVKKPCPDGKVRNPKTGKCKKIPKDVWTEQIEKEFHQILAQLRKPKLGGMFLETQDTTDCPKCIKQAKTQQLENQLASRKKTPLKVNILIPRKKKKVAV